MGSLAPPPAVYLVATALVLVPLPWHARTRNIPILALMFWIAQDNLFLGINAILWKGSVERKHLVYCDITLALGNAGTFGQVAAALCIARNMERISSPAWARSSIASRKRTLFEFLLCAVFPLVYAALHLVSQGNRFDIYEDIGCASTLWVTWTAIVLYILPRILISITTALYSVLAIQWFLLHRKMFQQVLNRSSPGMSQFQFYRLLALATAQSCVTLTTSIYNLVSMLWGGNLHPWISWGSIHSGFHMVFQFPSAILTDTFIRSALASGYVHAGAAFSFFLLFGLTSEILGDSRKALHCIQIRVLRRAPPWGGPSEVQPARTIQRFPKSIHSPRSNMTPPSRSPVPRVPRARWGPHASSGTGQDGRADWSQGTFANSHTYSNGSESRARFAFTKSPASPRPRSLIRPLPMRPLPPPPLLVDGVFVHLAVGSRSQPSSFQPSIAAHSPPRSRSHMHTRSAVSPPSPGFT